MLKGCSGGCPSSLHQHCEHECHTASCPSHVGRNINPSNSCQGVTSTSAGEMDEHTTSSCMPHALARGVSTGEVSTGYSCLVGTAPCGQRTVGENCIFLLHARMLEEHMAKVPVHTLQTRKLAIVARYLATQIAKQDAVHLTTLSWVASQWVQVSRRRCRALPGWTLS